MSGVGSAEVAVSEGETASCSVLMSRVYTAAQAAERISDNNGENWNIIVAGPIDDGDLVKIAGNLKDVPTDGCISLDLSRTTGLDLIGASKFMGCTSLSGIVLPEGIGSIEENAFSGCTSLASIEIPSSVTTIGDDAFKSCEALAAVYYNGTKKQWLSLKSSSIENSSGNTMLIMSKIICSDGEISPEFVKINAVSITGSETWTPTSNVFVSGRKLEIKAFYMCDHEVTQAEWKAVMGTTPSDMASTDGTADNNPVNCVSWYDAIVYCNKRSIKEGLTPCYKVNGSTNPDNWGDVPTSSDSKWNAAACDFEANGYRLPTEAEWEWAARGGENYTYAGSNTLDEVAWYEGNSSSKTHEVKTKKANGYGLYDMSGNVMEWCWDWYSDDISIDTPATGPSSAGSRRCQRGGCWNNYGGDCGVAKRSDYGPSSRYYNFGLRLVRSSE